MIVIKSILTPALTCINLPPEIKAPKSKPAKRTPIGCDLPKRATAIASKPILAENPGEAQPNTPLI